MIKYAPKNGSSARRVLGDPFGFDTAIEQRIFKFSGS